MGFLVHTVSLFSRRLLPLWFIVYREFRLGVSLSISLILCNVFSLDTMNEVVKENGSISSVYAQPPYSLSLPSPPLSLPSATLTSSTFNRTHPPLILSPFDYDPLIDDFPTTPKRERQVIKLHSGLGFQIGPFVGMYFGAAGSYLTPNLSSLDYGAFPQYGLHVGYQLSPRWTLGIDGSFGTGRTYEDRNYDDAFDVLFRPSLSFAPLNGRSWKWNIELGGQLAVYDLEEGQVSQIAVGPYTGSQILYKLSPLSHLYLGFGWSYLYDFFAYRFRPPTEEELMDNPNVVKFKVNGAWFHLNQWTLGYRISGF